jgi:hypothetical protein
MAPTFDTILNNILTDYANLDPAPDTGIGSQAFISASTLAASLWGLYTYMDNVNLQSFPGTATGAAVGGQLDNWGSTFSIPRITGESDVNYSIRMLGLLQTPPAGGNTQDYVNWGNAACGPNNPIPANLSEQFYNGSIDSMDPLIITLDQVTNPVGWINSDPIQFSNTSSGLTGLVNPPYYADATQLNGTTYAVAVYQDSALSNPVSVSSVGSGIISHYTVADDPNSFYISKVQVSTPNGPSSETTSAPGSVNVWIAPNDESILSPTDAYYPATFALETTVQNYIVSRQPITANRNTILMETLDNYMLTVTVSPVTVNSSQILSDLNTYINALAVGGRLYQAQLIGICLQDGAEQANITQLLTSSSVDITSVINSSPYYIQPLSGHSIRVTNITVIVQAGS